MELNVAVNASLKKYTLKSEVKMDALPSLPSTHYWDVRPAKRGTKLKLMKYGALKDKTVALAEVPFSQDLFDAAKNMKASHL
jgi:hypothetical protein